MTTSSMRSMPYVGALVALGACRQVTTVAGPSTDPSMPASTAALTDASPSAASGASSAVAAPREDAGATRGARGPLRWGTRPDPAATLAYAIDGYCVRANVDVLANATLVHYGEDGSQFVARATDDGLEDAEKLSRGLQPSPGADPGFSAISQIQGTYPDNLWLQVESDGRAYTDRHEYHFAGDRWSWAFSMREDERHGHVLPVEGGVIAASYTCGQVCIAGPIVASPGIKAPPLAGDGFNPAELVALPGGEYWALGTMCPAGASQDAPCTVQVRRWKPGGKRVVDVLGSAKQWTPLSIAVRSPEDAVVGLEGRFMRFDGTKWSRLAWSGRTAGGKVHLAPDGALWSVAENGRIERRAPDGTVSDVSPPRPLLSSYLRGAAIDGIEVGAPWAVLDDGTLVRRETSPKTSEGGASWVTVAIPRSPFAWSDSKTNHPKAEGVRVRAEGDVWINVKYVEWPQHYGTYDERRALLSTKIPGETYWCTNSGSGFTSSPPLATPSCATPMVVMATVDANDKTEWSQSRKVLAGKVDFKDVKLVQFTSDTRKILGAKPGSYELGKKLLAALRAQNSVAKPDMVCADPDGTKEIDRETGKPIGG